MYLILFFHTVHHSNDALLIIALKRLSISKVGFTFVAFNHIRKREEASN